MATAPHHCGVLYRPLLSLWKMSRRNWYFSLGPLSLCHVSGSMIWVHADLYQCTLFSLFLLGLTENSSIGFQWGVFHLRQSSLPLPTRRLFDGGYLFWDPTFQHVVWSEICSRCFCPLRSEKSSCFSAVMERCAATVLGCQLIWVKVVNVVLSHSTKLKIGLN